MITEDDVRRVLTERADLAPDPARLLAGVRDRSRTARRRVLAAGATALAASAAVVATVAVIFLPLEPDPRPAAAPTAGFEPGWLPEGYREVFRWTGQDVTTRVWKANDDKDPHSPGISLSISPVSAGHPLAKVTPVPKPFSQETVTVRGTSGFFLKMDDRDEMCSLIWREGGLEIGVGASKQKNGACATALRIAEAGRLTGAPVNVPMALQPGWTPEHLPISQVSQRKENGVCSAEIYLGETTPESGSSVLFIVTLSNEDIEFARGGTPVDIPAGPARLYYGPDSSEELPTVVVDLDGPWTLTVVRMDNAPADMSGLIRVTSELKVTSFPECDF